MVQNIHITHEIAELRENADLLKIEMESEDIAEIKNSNITIQQLGEARNNDDRKPLTNGTRSGGPEYQINSIT